MEMPGAVLTPAQVLDLLGQKVQGMFPSGSKTYCRCWDCFLSPCFEPCTRGMCCNRHTPIINHLTCVTG